METIRGKTSLDMDLNKLKERLANYNRIILDLGTGDGRYVHCLAEKNPSWFVIGLDSCRENLHEHSRAKLPNMLFRHCECTKLAMRSKWIDLPHHHQLSVGQFA